MGERLVPSRHFLFLVKKKKKIVDGRRAFVPPDSVFVCLRVTVSLLHHLHMFGPTTAWQPVSQIILTLCQSIRVLG